MTMCSLEGVGESEWQNSCPTALIEARRVEHSGELIAGGEPAEYWTLFG